MNDLLPKVVCPSCGKEMLHDLVTTARPVAMAFGSCIRRCEACGLGASNSHRPTFIYRDIVTNVPVEARAGAIETVRKALNVRNRKKKETYFGFSSSEDAVTWVVFSHLWRTNALMPVLQNLGILRDAADMGELELLLWGVPIRDSHRGREVRNGLIEQCLLLGELKRSLSEPDVLIDLGKSGLMLIEVKYLSGNDNQPASYANWQKYASPDRLGWNFELVKASGCYELARYWCLMERLAQGRKTWLINLGRPELFVGPEGERLDRFVSALGEHQSAKFMPLTWKDFLAPAMSTSEEWFTRFCRTDRQLGL